MFLYKDGKWENIASKLLSGHSLAYQKKHAQILLQTYE